MSLVCDLCGTRSLDVRPGLVAWRDPAQPYANVDRCSDAEKPVELVSKQPAILGRYSRRSLCDD